MRTALYARVSTPDKDQTRRRNYATCGSTPPLGARRWLANTWIRRVPPTTGGGPTGSA